MQLNWSVEADEVEILPREQSGQRGRGIEDISGIGDDTVTIDKSIFPFMGLYIYNLLKGELYQSSYCCSLKY